MKQKRSKELFREDLQKWHATTRVRLLRTGFHDNYDPKWGRFLSSQRLNVDQSPLPFAIDAKRTYEHVEAGKGHEHNTWISTPGDGLTKRQCSLQVCFRPVGKQPPLAIIFRGKGTRIRDDEKKAWHPDVHVYFQENAWVDNSLACQWMEKTIKPFIEEENLGPYTLFCDNLTAQTSDQFKEAVSDGRGLVWYGLRNATDLWQPVDVGIAYTLKQLIGQAHRDWLDFDVNSDRWFGHENSFTAMERRILLTHWSGEAWNKFTTDEKYEQVRWNAFERTGCLLTVDGSVDHLIKPEGLPNYAISTTSVLEPVDHLPSTNE